MDWTDTPSESGRASLAKMLAPLRTHTGFIVVFVLSAAITAVALTYSYSEQYRSEATIFFKPQAYPRVNAQQLEALGSPVPTTPFKVIGQTLAGIAKSESFLRGIVTDLHLDVETRDIDAVWYMRLYRETKDRVIDAVGDIWSLLKFGRIIKEDAATRAMRDLQKNTRVEHEDSYVYTIRVYYKRAAASAAVADAIATRLIDTLRDGDQATAAEQRDSLAKLLAAKTTSIEVLEARQRDILTSNQIGALQGEIDYGTARLSELQTSWARTQAQLKQEEARLADLRTKIGVGAAGGGKVTEALSNLGQNYTRFTTDKLSTETNVSGLRENLRSTQQSIDSLKQYLQRLAGVQVDYSLASNELQAAKRDYTVLTGALQELVIRQSSAQSELHLQDKAEIPELPTSPIKVYHFGLALLLALATAMGLATVFSYFGIDTFADPPPRAPASTSDASPAHPGEPFAQGGMAREAVQP